jgi:endonuclease-3
LKRWKNSPRNPIRRRSKLSERAEELVSRVLSKYERKWNPRYDEPFKALVATILSQNTNAKNRAKAQQRLEDRVGITPEKLTDAPLEAIADAIRPAGMYNQRSRVLKKVSQEVRERFGGNLNQVILQQYPESREKLMSLPGVGPKTADVVLMFAAGKPIVPIDRHIFRISKRIGIVSKRASYEEVQETLERASPPEHREDVHVFLIRLGRDICRARKPRCRECFLEDLCVYTEKNL